MCPQIRPMSDRYAALRRRYLPRPWRRTWRTFSLVPLLSMVAALLGVPTAQQSPATAAPSCDRVAVMNTRLDELGRAGYTWRFGVAPDGLWGVVGYPGPQDITISEAAPCDAIRTIVNHEWMHTRQFLLYPDRAQQAHGDAFEIVADCGSMLLGSPTTPYLERRKEATGQAGCTADELDSARRALGWPRTGVFGALQRHLPVELRQPRDLGRDDQPPDLRVVFEHLDHEVGVSLPGSFAITDREFVRRVTVSPSTAHFLNHSAAFSETAVPRLTSVRCAVGVFRRGPGSPRSTPASSCARLAFVTVSRFE